MWGRGGTSASRIRPRRREHGPAVGGLTALGLLVAVAGVAFSIAPVVGAEPSRADVSEPLPSPVPSAETSLSCWGHTRFPFETLDGPAGAQDAIGPEFDALRAGVAAVSDDWPWIVDADWHLVDRTDHDAFFLARGGHVGWVSAGVSDAFGSWTSTGFSDCRLMVVLGPGIGAATWALDPAFPAPGADTTMLHLLVWEEACSGGSSTFGRNVAPLVRSDADTVTITLGVRPLSGGATCPGTSGTPVTLTLGEPVGDRTLLDGAYFPPAAPGPPLPYSVVRVASPAPSDGPG